MTNFQGGACIDAVDDAGDTPLMEAASQGRVAVAVALIRSCL